VREPKCASRQKTSKSVGVVFVICSQVIESLQQNLPRYNESASGRLVGGFNTYGYVGGQPTRFIDPTGLDPGIRGGGYIPGPVPAGGTVTTNGSTVIVNAGIGVGGGLVLLPDVQMPGSGNAGGFVGFTAGVNLTLGPLSCSFNCTAGMEIFKDAAGITSTKYFEGCSPSPRIVPGGKAGTGANATISGGVVIGVRKP
jgi:hypothetical protein